uniref:Protein kinase C-terminal domain-containing protein n=1 Tax=Amazona collaria TaxID=241587 RepID=A0A8B9G476_9PSIT
GLPCQKPPKALEGLHHDVSNFDPDFIKEEPILTPIEEGVLPMINQDEFRNFSFTKDWGEMNEN